MRVITYGQLSKVLAEIAAEKGPDYSYPRGTSEGNFQGCKYNDTVGEVQVKCIIGEVMYKILGKVPLPTESCNNSSINVATVLLWLQTNGLRFTPMALSLASEVQRLQDANPKTNDNRWYNAVIMGLANIPYTASKDRVKYPTKVN